MDELRGCAGRTIRTACGGERNALAVVRSVLSAQPLCFHDQACVSLSDRPTL
jgi:hypothetical protein